MHFAPQGLTCKVCETGTLIPRKVFRLSGPAVAIGYILLIPSVLGMTFCALVFAGVFAATRQPDRVGGAAPSSSGRVTVADNSGGLTALEIENMTYILGTDQERTPVKFINGQAHTDAESYWIDEKSIVYGYLGAAGQNGAVLVLDENGGGSGTEEYLIAVWNASGTLMNSEGLDLGDRVSVNKIELNNGVVTIDMLTQGPNDPLCCPTQRTILRRTLQALPNGEGQQTGPVVETTGIGEHINKPDPLESYKPTFLRALGGGFALAMGIGFFVSGLLGWLLVMKKRVLKCDYCGAVVNAS